MGKNRKGEEELSRRLESLKAREDAVALREKIFLKMEKDLKDLHAFHCPRCGHELQAVLAENIEVETCEACKGMWIGRAEFEALIKFTVDRRKNFLSQVFGPA